MCQYNLKPDTCELLQYLGFIIPAYRSGLCNINNVLATSAWLIKGFNIDIYTYSNEIKFFQTSKMSLPTSIHST